jgi:hypothetical protein
MLKIVRSDIHRRIAFKGPDRGQHLKRRSDGITLAFERQNDDPQNREENQKTHDPGSEGVD